MKNMKDLKRESILTTSKMKISWTLIQDQGLDSSMTVRNQETQRSRIKMY